VGELRPRMCSPTPQPRHRESCAMTVGAGVRGSRWSGGPPLPLVHLSTRCQVVIDVVQLAALVMEPTRCPPGVRPGGVLADPSLDQCGDGTYYRCRS
jgi:hypothetical protein